MSLLDLMARSIVDRSTLGTRGKLQVLHGLPVGLLGRQVNIDLPYIRIFLQTLGPLEPGAIGMLLSRLTHYRSLSRETTLVSLLAPKVVSTGVLASGSSRVVCTVRITVVLMPMASALRG